MARKIIIGLIVAVMAFIASWLYTPKPPLSAAEELSAGQRVCKVVNDLVAKNGGSIDPPLTVADCVEANRDCKNRWGSNSVWAGVSDVDNIPVCTCDDGYRWAADGSGKCVKQQ